MSVNITDEKIDGKMVISLDGRIDTAASEPFLAKMTEIINSGCNTILVDFTDLAFISSAGLRVLLLSAKKVRPYGGKIILCCLSDDVHEVFNISGFSSMFPIFKTRQEGLDAMKE